MFGLEFICVLMSRQKQDPILENQVFKNLDTVESRFKKDCCYNRFFST